MRINIPPVTRVLLGAIIALSFLYNVARWKLAESQKDTNLTTARILSQPVPYLALIPAQVAYYPWTLITATLVEQNIITLFINGAVIFLGGKYLERAWGSKSFALTVVVTSIIPNLLTIPTYFLWGLMLGNPTRSSTQITGGITLQAAFLVAFKQLVPEHTVSVYKGVVKVRVKHFPAIFLLINTLSGFVLGTDTALILAWYGLITSWIYLRFIKHQPDLSAVGNDNTKLRGDASETFAFATFFPDVVQPPVSAVCDQIYLLLCNLKILKPFSDEAIANSNEHAAIRGSGTLPQFRSQTRAGKAMTKREEAERRRALALKALDQRLNASPSRPAATPATVNPNSEEYESLGQTDYRPDEA